MRRVVYCLIYLNVQLFFNSNPVFSQTTIEVSKTPSTEINKFYLDVIVRKNGELLDSIGRWSYDYSSIYRLPDSIKVRILNKLFEYVSDTSLCFNKVMIYENAENPGCFNEMPIAKQFSIRIETLFIINHIAYNSFNYRIGCYPVLFDSKTKREVNDDNCLISLMVEQYKKWFKMYKATGRLPDYHFLNEGRIKWWGRHL